MKLICLLLATNMIAGANANPQNAAFTVEVRGTGPAVFMLPGLASPGMVWAPIARQLQEHYQVHVFTLAGFAGVTPRVVKDGLLASTSEDLIRYAKAQGIEHPTMIGHSMGAVLSFSVCAKLNCKAVIAVDGVPFFPALLDPTATVKSATAPATAMRNAIANQSKDQFVAQQQLTMRSMIRDPAKADHWSVWTSKSDPATVAQIMFEVMTTDLRPSLRRIKAPILLIAATGAMPPTMQAGATAAYQAQLALAPDARLVVNPDSLHFVQLDQPKWLLAQIETFLNAGAQAR